MAKIISGTISMDDHKKLWVKQAASNMDERELAKSIILFLQHSEIPTDNNEAETAGYKMYLWADTILKDG